MLYGDDCTSKCCGKIVYASTTECERARIQLADAKLGNRTLRVNYWSGTLRKRETCDQQDRLSIALLAERTHSQTLTAIQYIAESPFQLGIGIDDSAHVIDMHTWFDRVAAYIWGA